MLPSQDLYSFALGNNNDCFKYYRKYLKYRLLWQIVQNLNGSDLKPELVRKLYEIQVKSTVPTVFTLGLEEPPENTVLPYKDCIEIRSVIQTVLHQIKNNLQMDKKPLISTGTSDLNALKTLLIHEFNRSTSLLMRIETVYENLIRLRTETVPVTITDKIEECRTISRLNSLKTCFAEEKARVDIFLESSSSLRAYRELLNDLDLEQLQCRKVIRDCETLKNCYEKVSSRQFDEILKSYREYKASLASLRNLMGQ